MADVGAEIVMDYHYSYSIALWASACTVEAIPGIILHPVVVPALVLARIRASSGAGEASRL